MVKLPAQSVFFCFIGLFVLNATGCVFNKRGQFDCYRTKRPSLLRVNRSELTSHAIQLFQEGRRLEQQGYDACVDLYFEAASLCSDSALAGESTLESSAANDQPIVRIYRSSLAKFIATAQKYDRYDPQLGIQIRSQVGCYRVPLRFQGFPDAQPTFHNLIPVGEYSSADLNRNYRCCGAGLSLVAINCNTRQEPFRRESRTVAATALLRHHSVSGSTHSKGFEIEVLDPLRFSMINHQGQWIPIRRDLTAPMAYVLSQSDKKYLQQFFYPGGTQSETGLFMVEPYQRGKIPILFVHGLLSDPLTWVNMANEIRSHPELVKHYQIWGFEYPTGQPFLKSAADLRQQLSELRHRLDPAGTDHSLSNMLVVGHSMGGLIAKLQVADSGEQLWHSVSKNQLSAIQTNDQTRWQLARSFYFCANPSIRRIVFIGTPHRGSPFATRPIGRLGSNLIEEPPSSRAQHQALIAQNPNNFSEEFTRRIPTSIDMLREDSCLLQATNRLCLSPHVQFHTILGSGFYMIGSGDSDSVVPVSSARFPGSVTERALFAKHTKINKSQQCIDELISIMRLHLRQTGQSDWHVNY